MREILITGGNGGLGRAIGRYFLEHDDACRVWLGVRSNREAAAGLVAEFPGRAELVELDVTDPPAWDAAVARITAVAGAGPEVLVNNAGTHADHLLGTMPVAAWRGVLSANLDAVFYGCQAVVRGMIARRSGRIVNISSLSALMAPLGQTNYAAAKAGVVAMTRSLAKEVARAGITVNAVLPGYIDTEALESLDEDARKDAKRGIPMRRFGRPEEVAALVFFLTCQEAGYVTGSAVKIDGGIY